MQLYSCQLAVSPLRGISRVDGMAVNTEVMNCLFRISTFNDCDGDSEMAVARCKVY